MTHPLTPDSHPLHFSATDLHDQAAASDRWLENIHPLDCIDVDIVRQSLNEGTRGAYARIQWLWHNIEAADSYLATCVERRESALAGIPWHIRPKNGLSDAEACLADAQIRTLTDLANAIVNIGDGISALGQASFRHYKHLQMLDTGSELRLNITDNWNWCRNGYKGPWRWNPSATYGNTRGIDLPADVHPSSIITRICPRPIDQVAMLLVLERKNTKAQWLTFNGRYGVPPLYIIMPEGISEPVKDAYIEFARQCISNSAGVLPPGSKIETVQPGNLGPDTFQRIYELSSQEIVLRCTGGLMTMLAAPGAGTTTSTGNTHQDAFDQIARREGADIASVLQRHLFAPALDQWHPGQPHLAEFVIEPRQDKGTSEIVQTIATLATAGYRLPEQQIADLIGMDVTAASEPPPSGRPSPVQPPSHQHHPLAALHSMHLRYAPTMLWPRARDTYEAACAIRLNSIAPQDTRTPQPHETASTRPQPQTAATDQESAPASGAPEHPSCTPSPRARTMHGAARATSAEPSDPEHQPTDETDENNPEAATNYGTSDGARKGWDKRGRGRRDDWQQAREGMTSKQNAANATRAMRWGMNNRKNAERVMHRKSLGWVDLPYGRPGTQKTTPSGASHADGYGLSHIEAKHGERALRRMPLILAYGKITRHASDPDKITVTYGSEKVHLRKNGPKKSWAITSYDENKHGKRDDY